MTLTTTSGDDRPRRRHRGPDTYDNIEPWFEKLAALPADDPRRARMREHILTLSLPLAEHIARRFAGRNVDRDDLIQVARLGLVLAVDRFDVSRGSTFLSYAVPTITGEVRRYFRDSTWATRVPREMKELHLRLGPATEALAHRLHRMPTARELAEELGVDLLDITRARAASNAYSAESLTTAVTGRDSEDNPIDLCDVVGSDEPGYVLTEESITIGPLLGELPERERTILSMRFGRNMTQTQIADRLGLSQMHISRILTRTLRDLREQVLTTRCGTT